MSPAIIFRLNTLKGSTKASAVKLLRLNTLTGPKPLWQDFRTGPYFIMHTLLCFMNTIAITIDVLWGCGALFFPFRGFFSKSIWTLKKPVELLSEIRKIEQFFLQFRHFSCNFTHFSVVSARSGVSSNRCNRVQIRKHNKQTK